MMQQNSKKPATGKYSTVRHAVVEDGRIVWISDGERRLQAKKLAQPVRHVSELWTIGQALGITHFWIMPGTVADNAGYEFSSKLDGWHTWAMDDDDDVEDEEMARLKRPKQPRGVECWKEETGGGTHKVLVFYPYREPWKWVCGCALDVLACLDYLQQHLATPVQWSPARIGKNLHKALFSSTNRLQAYIRVPKPELMEQAPFGPKAAKVVRWRGAIGQELVGQWLHLYDKNSHHPTAAAAMMPGSGDPVHLDSGVITPDKPGAYRVTFDIADSQFDGVTLPPIITTPWVTRDLLKFAVKQGYRVTIHEAWIFPESHGKLFDEWTQDLWNVRTWLKDTLRFPHATGRENASMTIKLIMTSTISAMKDRKHWWTDMVGMSCAMLLANLAEFACEGYRPVLAIQDQVVYASPVADPYQAVHGSRMYKDSILARADKMGGYKLMGSVQITPEMVKGCEGLNPGSLYKYLKGFIKEAK